MNIGSVSPATSHFAARIDLIEIELPHRHMSRVSRRPFHQLGCKAVFPRNEAGLKVQLLEPTAADMKALREMLPHAVLSKVKVAFALQENFRILDRGWGFTERLHGTPPTGWGSSCVPLDKAEVLRVVYDGLDQVKGGFLEIGAFSLHSKWIYCLKDLFDMQVARVFADCFKPLWAVVADDGDGVAGFASDKGRQALISLFLDFAPPFGRASELQSSIRLNGLVPRLAS